MGSLGARLSMAASLAFALLHVEPATAQPLAAARAQANSKADKKAKKKARRYEKKAKKAYKKQRWDDAISAFELAHEAWPKSTYLFNIGRAYERKGDLFKAMEYVQAYAALAESEEEREDARELAAILEKNLRKTSGKLVLTSTPTGATARLLGPSGEVRGKTPMTRWLKSGAYDLELGIKAHVPHKESFTVEIGGALEHAVKLRSTADEAAAAKTEAEAKAAHTAAREAKSEEQAAAAAEAERRSAEADRKRAKAGGPGVLTWALFGGGIALLGGGAVFGLMADGSNQTIRDMEESPKSGTWAEAEAAGDDAESQALVANVLYAAGGLAVAGGATLWLMGGESGEADAAWTPWVSDNAGGLAARGQW